MPQTVEELKTKKQNQLLLLQKELESATRQESKKSFSKQIELTEKLLEQIAAYENINEGDFVCNGNSEEFGKVFKKELQNSLPVIWVDWDGVQISHAPDTLTVVSPDLKSEAHRRSQKEIRKEIIIDPEFKALIPPLSPNERQQLEENLINEGCRDPLVIWKNHNILLDGHNRYELCSIHNISYNTVEIELETRNAVQDWIISNQLGRRNLKPEVASYLRAKLYESLKQSHGGDRGNQYTKVAKGHFDPLAKPKISTAKKVAEKTGVSEKTIKRDAKYAESVDQIASKAGVSPQEVLNSGLSKKQAQEVSKQSPEVIRQKLENPKAESPRELPNLKVGQLVQLKSNRTNPDLVDYNKSYGVVRKIYQAIADIEVWGKPLQGVQLQFLVPVEGKTSICANLEPEFLVQLMENYQSFNDAVAQIPLNKYREGQKVRVVSSYREGEIGTVTQSVGGTKSNVMFSDGTVELFENRNLLNQLVGK